MSITFNGIGSGLDIDSIVQAIVEAERAPAQNRLDRLETDTTEELSAVGQLSSALSDFMTVVEDLGDEDLYRGRSVSIGDRELLDATVDESAQTGSYQLQIEQVATSHKIATQAVAAGSSTIGTGTLTLHMGNSSFDVVIDEENDTLAGIRDAINNDPSNIGVRASIINDDTGARLVITGDETGLENTVAITVEDDDGNSRDTGGLSALTFDPNDINSVGDGGVTHDAKELATPQDALLYIDGLTVTSASNNVENVIDGVNLNILSAQSEEDYANGNTINLTITNDQAAISDTVNNFIDVYNSFMSVVDQLTVVVVNEGSTGNLTGALTGDSTARNLVSTIRTQLSTGVEENPDGMQFLVNLGITTNDEGQLTLDSAKLDKALANNFDDIGALFTGENGFAKRMETALEGYTGAGNILELRQDRLQNTLNDVDTRREKLDERISLVEARLYSQYQAADSLIGSLNNTLSYLTSIGTINNDDD
ncbi:flagellar filament capping protein FliD [Halioxenophilus aromaticivorans]|uniref:Flagellar hook-associated protein 2 n=1 Tax=Halioxenophilus aromaticivorans TaxID=1306992 RepID=A0AAV3U0A1_9ALTE